MNKTILDMKINNTVKWRKKHWMSIYLNYKNTKYFSTFSDFFHDMYNKEWFYLNDILEYQLEFLLNTLKINTKVMNLSNLNIKSKKNDLIIEMCKLTNSNKFIFGKLGAEYVDLDLFSMNDIGSEYQDYKHPTYTQVGDDFLSNLSVIDLLFNEGPDKSLDIIMGNENG